MKTIEKYIKKLDDEYLKDGDNVIKFTYGIYKCTIQKHACCYELVVNCCSCSKPTVKEIIKELKCYGM